MVTRRTRRKQTRKGSGKYFTQPLRNLGFDIFGSSTSLLAREIRAMLGPNGIKDYRQGDFDNLMRHHPHVNKGKLLRDLQKLGMTPKQEYNVVANLEYIIPSHRNELTYNQ
jgi:hypothetical protein